MGSHLIKDEIIYNNDMVNLVLENINYGSVWKNIRSVSKYIYFLSIKYQRGKLIELGNPILSLIYTFPNEDWSLSYLSNKGIITIDFIKLTYNRIPWTKQMISMSSGITIDDIINSDPNSIDWKVLSMNPSIKVSDMLKYDYLPWDYEYASINRSIRIEDIRNNLSKDWDYSKLAINSSLSIEDISTIMDLTITYLWIFNENTTYENPIVSINIDNTTYENLIGTIDIDSIIVRCIKLNENILQSYLDKDPNIMAHQINKQSITPNIIKNNPQLDWDNIYLDYSNFTVEEVVNIPLTSEFNIRPILNHPDFTIDDFFKYFDIDTFRNWYILSQSSWLTFDIVLEYKDTIPWVHLALSANPNVTIDILEDSDFSWIKWNYIYLSRYAQLNWVYILENSNKGWNIYKLVRNKSLRI